MTTKKVKNKQPAKKKAVKKKEAVVKKKEAVKKKAVVKKKEVVKDDLDNTKHLFTNTIQRSVSHRGYLADDGEFISKSQCCILNITTGTMIEILPNIFVGSEIDCVSHVAHLPVAKRENLIIHPMTCLQFKEYR